MTNKDTIEWLMVVKDKFLPKDDDWYDEKYREAVDTAIKALEQTDCGKCEYLVYDEVFNEETGDEYDASYCRKQEDYMYREFVEILVSYPPADLCIYSEYKGKPYYSIKYRENGKEYVGFGTYKIEILSQWIKDYFIAGVQPKTGHWIEIVVNGQHKIKCDKCDYIEPLYITHIRNYCPNCGTKMIEPQESEDTVPFDFELYQAGLMEFPETFEKFAKEYGFKDDKEVYTNGSDLIPIFRVKQWLEHDNKLRTIEKDTAYECGKHANKWIPVSERLPDFNDIVLASTDSDYDELRVILTVYSGEEFWFNGKIKAWMPLPEPYKAERSDKE